MSKLIGTAPNQVPSNADLGTMAYQDYDVVAPVLKGGRRNLIINGGFNVWQRGTTGAAVNAFVYASADRWEMVRSSLDKATDSQGKDYAKITCGNWADNNYISQHVEVTGLGLGGKSITFSFNINSPTLSDGRVYIRSSTNGGTSWDTVIWDEGEFTYTSTDTRYSFTGQLPSGAINQIQVFIYGHRTTTNQNGEYFNVSDVQLELGEVATPFEHRSYGEELALCQRYFERIGIGCPAIANSSTGFWTGVTFKAEKRTTPSVSLVSTTMRYYKFGITNRDTTSASIYQVYNNKNGILVRVEGFSGLTANESVLLGGPVGGVEADTFNIDAEL